MSEAVVKMDVRIILIFYCRFSDWIYSYIDQRTKLAAMNLFVIDSISYKDK